MPTVADFQQRIDISAARGEVELLTQSIDGAKPPAFIRRDVYALVSMLGLLPVANLIGERHWPEVCLALTRWAVGGRQRRAKRMAGLRIAFADDQSAGDAFMHRVCRDLEVHELEHRLHVFRAMTSRDWRPEIRLEGTAYLEAAIANGAGAILWIDRFVFADTIAKIGLKDAGRPMAHLSRTDHGFSHSGFARRWLNPLQWRVEDRYLAERIFVNEAAPAVAVRRLHRNLSKNGIVSIAALSTGAHAADVPLLGGRLRLATGAPSLAWKSGAHLLPLSVIRPSTGSEYCVSIEAPLPIDRTRSKACAQRSAMASYAARLTSRIADAPGQWLDWAKLRPRH